MKFIGLTTKYKVSRERLKAGISVGIIFVICSISVVTVNALIQAREDDYKERTDERFAKIVFESEEVEETKKTSTDPVKHGSGELEAPSSEIKVFETTEASYTSASESETSEETSESSKASETSAEESVKTESSTAKETEATSTTTVSQATPEPAYTETKLIKFVYASDKLNVRSEPNTDCEVVKTIEKGSGIDVIAVTSNGWYHTYNDNYVLKEYCQDTPVIITATPTAVPQKPKTEETKSTTAATTTTEATTQATTEATTEATTAATTAATEATTAAPQETQAPSNNGMTYYGSCKITFYGPQPNGDGTFNTGTATGATCVQGETVAADWNIFPAGTRIYIANDPLGGDGYYTVQDRGSGVNGNHIDIYADDGESMSTTTAEVYIVN